MIERLFIALFMSFILSFLMTCWITWVNLGWSQEFASQWLTAFLLAWPAATLIAFVSGPAVRSLVLKIIK